MNREIKFRGIDVETEKFIIGNLFIPNKLIKGIWICEETTYGDFYPGLQEGDVIEDFKGHGISLGHFKEVLPETIGEFIGVKDIKGNECFEGDIVKRKETSSNTNYEAIYIIIHKNNSFVLQVIQSHVFKKGSIISVIEDIEIIGNIHKNKEFLN